MNNLDLQKRITAQMNRLGASRKPFFFMIDFEGEQAIIRTQEELGDIQFDFNGVTHQQAIISSHKPLIWDVIPPPLDTYQEAFDIVQHGLHRGDSYLINLTFKSFLETNYSLGELYHLATAKYKLYIPDTLTLFSPESFVKIKDGTISSYPMKGTIRADRANAEQNILGNQKEMAEHSTIVDLIRNDLSIVSKQVKVTRWRYTDTIETPTGPLLQVSSMIEGTLQRDWHERVGSIVTGLLPAGSISGAPKKKTIDIIRRAERRDRGWYTGICGYYDGKVLDSGVMIRMISHENQSKYYHSGGGITAMSELHSEYQELQDKIYVPISGDHQGKRRQDLSTATAQ